MKQLIFTVFDAKAEAFTAPFTAKTRGLAIRMFQELVNTEGHQFNKFPDDYTLFIVGEWDEAIGHAKSHAPESMGTAIGYLNNQHVLEAVG